MPLDIPAIQTALSTEQIDGWLLYDFHGSNPIAVKLAGLAGRHTTRRWYYFIPASGSPRKLVHAIESTVLDGLPGDRHTYAGRLELERGVGDVLRGSHVVAMEYSPLGAIPYLSRVDGGTLEFIETLGVAVVSSGDLVGRFEAAWDAEAIATHRAASEKLHRIKDRAFEFAGAHLASGHSTHEFAIQQFMVQCFADDGLVADFPPIVAVQENAGNPHYQPTADRSRPLRRGEVLLLDLWGKLATPGAVYADITWVGCSGEPPVEVVRAFGVAAAARDAAVTKVQSALAAGLTVRGWEVDRAARDLIAAKGYGQYFVHRTGHSLGEDVHGSGVNMDDYETHDDRRLLPGTGFTIEPGIYTHEFGVRTEINLVVSETSAEVTGPRQSELVKIL